MKIDLFNSLINIINQANEIQYLVTKSGIFIYKNKFSLTEPKKYDIINYIRKDKNIKLCLQKSNLNNGV